MRESEQGRGNGRVGEAEGERTRNKDRAEQLLHPPSRQAPSEGLRGPQRLNEPGASHDSVSVAPARQILPGSAVSTGKGARPPPPTTSLIQHLL